MRCVLGQAMHALFNDHGCITVEQGVLTRGFRSGIAGISEQANKASRLFIRLAACPTVVRPI